MGKIIMIDGDKVREKLKTAERSLAYWKGLEDSHPNGDMSFEKEIARASAKIEAFTFVLSQCSIWGEKEWKKIRSMSISVQDAKKSTILNFPNRVILH